MPVTNKVKSWSQSLGWLCFILALTVFSYSQKNLAREDLVLRSEVNGIKLDLFNLRYFLENCSTEIGEQALNNIKRDKQLTELKEETVSLGEVLVEVIDNTEKTGKIAENKKSKMPLSLDPEIAEEIKNTDRSQPANGRDEKLSEEMVGDLPEPEEEF